MHKNQLVASLRADRILYTAGRTTNRNAESHRQPTAVKLATARTSGVLALAHSSTSGSLVDPAAVWDPRARGPRGPDAHSAQRPSDNYQSCIARRSNTVRQASPAWTSRVCATRALVRNLDERTCARATTASPWRRCRPVARILGAPKGNDELADMGSGS